MSSRLLRIILLILIPIILLSISSSWILEVLWLSELGYSQIFWTLKTTQIILIVAAFLIVGSYLVPNFRYLADQLKQVSFSGTPLQGVDFDIHSPNQQKRIKQFFTIAALVITAMFAFGFYIRWDESLQFVWNVPFGETDPLFGRDIGFYMFQLPFWELIQTSMLILTFLTTAILAVIYLFSGLLGMQPGQGFTASKPVLNHLKLNGGLWLLFLAWGFYLDRFNLLYRSDGIVFGAGYTDVMVELPAIWILFAVTLILALMVLASRWMNFGKALPGMAILGVLVFAGGKIVMPGVIQNFSVNPNELELETPYLENNIQMTRLAFGLDNVREIEYQADDTLTLADIRNNQDAIDNIRLWDPRLLIQTYKQLQEIRSYYEFYSVDNDRYTVDGQTTQMMLSAREIARTLPSQSDTWVNRRMQYTHGYGLAMSPVTETTRQGEPRLVIRDLPPVYTSPDLRIDNPAIYYGENSTGYYIVNTNVEELHYPAGDENVYTHYSGQGGIQFTNFFRKLLFSWELGDVNILLSDYIHNESRLQIWRSVQERIQRITPFLQLDNDPYLVKNNGKLYWIQDAYTTSNHFPYSTTKRGINYIRNSVKIVVDAYEGSVDYYMVDENDPILQVYSSIFPDLFKPVSEVPEGMNAHFRYPQDLFEIQMETFNRYHMTRPQVFYNQEDLWTRPNEKYGGRQILMEPYYVLARLPEEEELEFMLISPLTPENRDNMISWLAAKSDPAEYGQLIVYKLPKDRLIYGPAQIEARIDQDPEISRQIALWDQRGSSVIRGNLMVIPIENSFLYVEPVFLLADGVDIPQLQRVIVAIGDNIAMQPTIEGAMLELFGDIAGIQAPPLVQTIADAELTQEEIALRQDLESEEMNRLRELWQDMRTALEEGDWTRYGEILSEMDSLIDG
ncbi:UPF0182 family protein [Rhodohalobacter sp. SW132]|uniref:UPF0182 family membrane protein n=1 Tax=Rhodohalobacter sp. SW132 TaxID=2293433 RepID=UPI000E238192|nr:UPF0182 family protein [Rhodohalobacter sp. SW132]REL24687.1 UPF0182 family protein [Rhodohalobacter sp. SW132]